MILHHISILEDAISFFNDSDQHYQYFCFNRLVEDCIEIEKIREETRLRLIREADEKSKDDDDAANIFDDIVNNGAIKENNEENTGQQSDANFTGDATD